ncbi:MAG: carbon-nitrogen family hydrolase [Candidatus Hecatellaceae archaeon]
MGRKIKVCLLQMEVADGNIDVNRGKAERLIREAAKQKPDFILLPELWNTGYQLETARQLAEPLEGETVKRLLTLAEEYGVYILGSIIELRAGKLYNTMPIIAPNGLIEAYSKIHLFKPMREDEFFTAGDKPGFFKTPKGTFGAAICYDLRFPELFRLLALKGVEAVFLAASFPRLLDHWRHLIYARAIENQFFMVAVNRVGRLGSLEFFGHSMVVAPSGVALLEAGSSEGIFTCELDLDLVEEERGRIFHLQGRRPEVYRLGF